MSTRSLVPAWLLAGVVIPMLGSPAAAEEAANVRPAYMAGSWYPAEPDALAKLLDDALSQAKPPEISGKPEAIIVPHAGYRFSAPVAAPAYRCLEGQTYKRVILIAFSHRNAGRYEGVDVQHEYTAYETPLGQVPIDTEARDEFLTGAVFVSNPGVDQGEHSLELQLPWLQRVLKGQPFKLVPLYVGRMDADDDARAAEAILPMLDPDTLVVVSSDFTHFGPNYGYQPFREEVPEKLRNLADEATAPLLACDFDGFAKHLEETQDTICGRGPILLLLRMLSMQGGAQGVRAGFDMSGRMLNDWTNSVSYVSVVFTSRPGKLGAHPRDLLLKLARETASAYLKGQPLPTVDAETLPPEVRANGACFVTLMNHGQLRGCIGNMIATGPLYQAVMQNAVSACRDFRFVSNPVSAGELDDIDIEISYLTPMQPVKSTDEIVIGRHGLLIELGGNRGVLLPQVAYERGWTREEFLAQVCRKAGLPPDAWKRPEAKLSCFEAEVFGEPEGKEPSPERD